MRNNNTRQLNQTFFTFNSILHAIIDNILQRNKFPENLAKNIDIMQDDDLLKQNQAAEGKTSSTEGRLEQDQLRSK